MTRHRPAFTRTLIAIILVVFVLEGLAGIPLWGVGNEHTPRLAAIGAINSNVFANGEYWRLVTAIFLHIGILHLLLNVWALYQLGSVFEVLFGSGRFALTYFVSGIVASIASARYIAPGTISAGASGAIFGILGALIIAIRRSPRWRNESWARGLTGQLIFWAAINILVISRFPGIDNRAHIGGFVAGLVLGLIPHRVPPPPPNEMVIDVDRTPGHFGSE